MFKEILIACAWKGTLVLVAALGLTAILRRASAAARHLVWTIAFGALLLLPFLTRMTPVWTATTPVVFDAPVATSAVRAAPADSRIDWTPFVWLFGAVMVFSRFAVGTARVWLKARRARPMQIESTVKLLDDGPGATPITWGVFRPVILLPSEAMAWPAERLRVVLLHELAHVSRWDCLTLAISEISLSLYWFHPLAWWASNRMRHEREQACDDLVLAAGVPASNYARDLLEIARGLSSKRKPSLAAPAVARGSNLEQRLRAILNPNIARRALTARVAVAMTGGALLALLPLASLRLLGQGSGLSGVVYDASRAVIPGATISITASDTGVTQATSSDAAGRYSFPTLATGQYEVRVSSPGFAPLLSRVVVPGMFNANLTLGSVNELVTVSGKRPPTSTPNGTPQRIRVGGNVQAARLVQQRKPVYPARAESASVEGTVSMQAIIGKDGATRGLYLLSSPDPELADAAMEAVQHWVYLPTLLNGQPVEVVTKIDVDFRLDQ